jgi:hypothetical protein
MDTKGRAMSDAIALQATEQCRDLVADPRKWGLEPRPGLEPLDVSVRFNRVAAHTKSAFQVLVHMKITLDEGQTYRDEWALVGEGKTKGEALEMFYNWLADDNAMTVFHEVIKAHDAKQLDALAEKAIAETRAADAERIQRTRENQHEWLAKKFDHMGREAGLVKGKIQTP